MAGTAAKIALQKSRIEVFHKLHHKNLLLLPNAWDCISAKIFEQEGAAAIGTTSAGIAASLGYADGEQMPKNVFLETVERIVSSVSIPVSVDIEAGYGHTTAEICDTVQKVIDLGAVGINIEDTDPVTNELLPTSVQAERVGAIRRVVNDSSLNVFINARTDTYWSKLIPLEKRLEECMDRLRAYKSAGAHGIFVPGLTDIGLITKICSEIQLPLNVLGGGWIDPRVVNDLKVAGVSRISAGSGIFRASVTSTQDKYREFSKGSAGFLKDSLTYDQINNLFK